MAESEARNAANANFDQLIVTQIDTAKRDVEKALLIDLAENASIENVRAKVQAQEQVIASVAALVELLRALD